MSENALLQIQDLRKLFLVDKKPFSRQATYLKAVDGISFVMPQEEVLGLVGESGSGKSTVAYTVIGMYKPTSGKILFQGVDISTGASGRPLSIKKDLQIVFQDPGSSLNPRRSIRQIIERPLVVHRMVRGGRTRDAVAELLEMVELPPDYMQKYPPYVGGGERQLVSIARAMASKPKFLILDEPTSALDVSVQGKIINTLIRLRREMKLSYLFITHDLSLMRNVADRVAIMYLGKICEIAGTVEFFEQPLHPYTQMLLSSIPVISDQEEELKPKHITPRGEIPSPVNLPSGCSFHTRCPYVEERCRQEDPAMKELRPGHFVRCHLAS
ncbi:MAG: ABC transporter ATP-binding protein [bacterium]